MATADTIDTASLDGDARPSPRRLALVVVWSRHEPWRVGEVALLPRTGPGVLGRGEPRADDPGERLRWVRQRPGENRPSEPMSSPGLSRVQLLASTHSAGASLHNAGRRKLIVAGRATDEVVLAPGQTAELENELVLLVARRPAALPAARFFAAEDAGAFGAPDRFGMVGETPDAWALREELAFAAGRDLHVLLLGPSGSGKELAARTIHALSAAHRHKLVARNAATLPSGLVEAELFGNVKDYPNPGMQERGGLVGAADDSTLFLDEIGELPEEQQAKLLRVLDADGEYHRLGEDRARRSKLRLVAATNRSVARIKHDLLARLSLRIALPPLAERREDVPLIARQLLLDMAAEDPSIADRFVEATERGPFPRLRPELAQRLVTEPLELGVRELGTLLWEAVRRSEGTWLAARSGPAVAPSPATGPEPAELSEEQIRAALEATGWVVSRAYRELGLESRHVLHRLMRKHGIERS
ncbi:MAG: sigma-54-dependent Fis family transcriptional regulator [Sandaracinaceae bacterium]|nr:sigma-54-dependent Fis family transcriptional regulator [Sandaracinaceae bacterium]